MDSFRPRVLVASDSPITRAGLVSLLRLRSGVETTGECALTDVASVVERDDPDAVVLDVSSLDDAPAAIAALTAEFRSLAVVALATAPSSTAVAECLRGGAAAWLLQSATPEQLEAAILASASGLIALDDRAATALLAGLPGSPVRSEAGDLLTARELEVLRLAARGYPSKTIARELGISEHTAKFHISAILGKLGASSRTEAVTTAIRRGLIAI